jgi:hypothetical protein
VASRAIKCTVTGNFRMSPHPPRVDVCILHGADAIADDRASAQSSAGVTSAGEA